MAATVDHGRCRKGDKACCAGSAKLTIVPATAGEAFVTATPVVSIVLLIKVSPGRCCADGMSIYSL